MVPKYFRTVYVVRMVQIESRRHCWGNDSSHGFWGSDEVRCRAPALERASLFYHESNSLKVATSAAYGDELNASELYFYKHVEKVGIVFQVNFFNAMDTQEVRHCQAFDSEGAEMPSSWASVARLAGEPEEVQFVDGGSRLLNRAQTFVGEGMAPSSAPCSPAFNAALDEQSAILQEDLDRRLRMLDLYAWQNGRIAKDLDERQSTADTLAEDLDVLQVELHARELDVDSRSREVQGEEAQLRRRSEDCARAMLERWRQLDEAEASVVAEARAAQALAVQHAQHLGSLASAQRHLAAAAEAAARLASARAALDDRVQDIEAREAALHCVEGSWILRVRQACGFQAARGPQSGRLAPLFGGGGACGGIMGQSRADYAEEIRVEVIDRVVAELLRTDPCLLKDSGTVRTVVSSSLGGAFLGRPHELSPASAGSPAPQRLPGGGPLKASARGGVWPSRSSDELPSSSSHVLPVRFPPLSPPPLAPPHGRVLASSASLESLATKTASFGSSGPPLGDDAGPRRAPPGGAAAAPHGMRPSAVVALPAYATYQPTLSYQPSVGSGAGGGSVRSAAAIDASAASPGRASAPPPATAVAPPAPTALAPAMASMGATPAGYPAMQGCGHVTPKTGVRLLRSTISSPVTFSTACSAAGVVGPPPPQPCFQPQSPFAAQRAASLSPPCMTWRAAAPTRPAAFVAAPTAAAAARAALPHGLPPPSLR